MDHANADLNGPGVRAALVTGAGQGIGREEALELAEHGFAVMVNDVDSEAAEGTRALVERGGGTARVSIVDVGSWDNARLIVEETLRAFGRLDVVVNNAGIIRDRMVFNLDEEQWNDVIRVHLSGTFFVTRFACAHWREQAKGTAAPVDGRIINTTSRSGLFGNPGQANYGAAKAGIAALTMIVAREMKKYGVTCNAVSPRAYTGPMRATFGDFDEDEIAAWSPRAVARFVSLLACDAGAAITGQVFIVRGSEISLVKPWEIATVSELPDSYIDEGEAFFDEVFASHPRVIPDYQADIDMPVAERTRG